MQEILAKDSDMKPLCSISLDLDNQWSYMKIHGDNNWKNYPSYLNTFVPYILNILKELNLKITFFVVGKDAAINENSDVLKMISNSHEIGNHSFNHESWLHLYSKDEIKGEISKAEEAIEKITGEMTNGFRGPGFSWNNDLIEILTQKGYLYDASILPTFIGPLARLYYFKSTNLSEEEKLYRKELFGKFKDGFRKLKPFYWELNSGKKILEIPVSTIPFFKTPFHLSYLIYLNNISPLLRSVYFETAIKLCKLTGSEPSFLLHPLDLIGGDQIKELAFFPGMNIKSDNKIQLFFEIVKELKNNFHLVNMSAHAKQVIKRKNIKSRILH